MLELHETAYLRSKSIPHSAGPKLYRIDICELNYLESHINGTNSKFLLLIDQHKGVI